MKKHKPQGQQAHGLPTALVHGKPVPPTGFAALPTPVYRGSSTFFESTEAQRAEVDTLGHDYSYGLHGNPTQYTLAQRLAHIEGAKHALLCPSGLAAITLVATACLKTGDHWLIPENVYGPVYTLARQLKTDFQIDFSEYNPCDVSSLAGLVRQNTRLLWAEAPGSLTFEVPDLKTLLDFARQHKLFSAIDNTWSAGMAYKPFEHGFDFSVQALTKYQCGHADVLMGAVLAEETENFALVERRNRVFGLGVSPEDCALVLRGLLTLPLRYAHQAQSALDVAQFLAQHPAIARVLHPAMPSCPGHAHFKRDFTGSASVFSVVLKSELTDTQACALVDQLDLFNIAYSWGGPESLALVVNVPESRRRHVAEPSGLCGPIVRLAIGLEEPGDLIADLQQALAALSG